MAEKLTGMLNLSKIPKELIGTTKKGERCIFVDLVPRKEADEYGNTHYLRMYNKNTKESIYLGNFKPESFGNGQSQAPTKRKVEDDLPDLPF